ncbi:hypothetical protein ACHAWO_001398 [Cyclotella atomus]|uniref:Uncharacterized protein n=1 Tax=Cyclotella atomus TaxID=382360 RepID=A0ABD3QMT8_9STRA
MYEHLPNKPQRRNTSASSSGVHLSVGGIDRTIRHLLLTKLHDASSTNPLCDVLLNEHWSNSDANVATPTVVDRHGVKLAYIWIAM